MPTISAVFLVLSLVLAVVIGPQTRAWSWGPAMLALGISTAVALPALWKKSWHPSEFAIYALGLLVAGWFAWRAWFSPVRELADADLMLLAGAVGAFVSIRVIQGNKLAESILIWGISLLLLANVAVIAMQVADPAFSPVFRSRASVFPSGFYAHYNEAANYLIASSMLVAAAALFGRNHSVVRIFWALVAVAGLVAVYYTRSRGGILGTALAGCIFAFGAAVVGKRSGARWFSVFVIATPIVGLILGAFLFSGWDKAQEQRSADTGISILFDNNYRLYLLGIAFSCIAQHPLAGGGSRSFSWESFRFYDVDLHGSAITRKPELVHNEFLQAGTDYGLIGVGLLMVLLGTLILIALIRLMFSERFSASSTGNFWLLGGVAALAGMLVQSCFSFVFHLFPGILLLGICLGMISWTSAAAVTYRPQLIGTKILLTVVTILCAACLFPEGWKKARITQILWPTYFSKTPPVLPESGIGALTDAIAIWPTSEFYQERGILFLKAAADGAEIPRATENAIHDFRQAAKLHPHDPGPQVNLANLLSHEQRDQEAEVAYELAIQLQGGMESAYKAHLFHIKHLLRKAGRLFSPETPSPTLEVMEAAAGEMEKSIKQMQWIGLESIETRVSVHESLGVAREANGDYDGAMTSYDFASKLRGGSRVHYRAGLLLGKKASAAWSGRRPSEALTYFVEAKRRITAARELPSGVSLSQRSEYLDYLDRSVNYLRGAKVEPLPELPR